MTSKKSFWARFLRNNTSKIWLWVVSFITMLILYPGVMLVYFNRISGMYTSDTPAGRKILDYNMNLAVCEAIGFRDNLIFIIMALVCAVGIFAYVNNRNKIDVLKSIPVSSGKQFASDYISGIVIVFVTFLFSIICTIILAAGWGYLPGTAIKQCLFMIVMNLLMFVFYYSVSVICIMLTGNIFVAVGLTLVVGYGLDLYSSRFYSFKYTFFNTAECSFVYGNTQIAPAVSFNENIWKLSNCKTFGEIFKVVAPSLIHLVIGCAVLVPLAYLCYKKRPAEAINKAIYNRVFSLIVKVFVSVYVAIGVGDVIYGSSSESKSLMILATVLSGALIGMAFDALLAFDIKAVVRSWWSSLVGIIIAVFIVAVYMFDLAGYDQYIPSKDNVESYAVDMYTNGYADSFEKTLDENGKIVECNWADNAQQYLKHMYLTDVDAIARLSEIALEHNQYRDENISTTMSINVYYRRKNLPDVSRCIVLDSSDEETRRLLDRIVDTDEWRNGYYQFEYDRDTFLNNRMKITYSNGISENIVGADMKEILEAYEKDFAEFDFTKGVEDVPCGKICIRPYEYWMFSLPVYEDYENTLNLLKEDESYLSGRITSDDVTSIRITNYHNEVWDENYQETYGTYEGDSSVSIVVTEPEKIDDILENSYPNELSGFWGIVNTDLYSYGIDVFMNSDYPVTGYYDYIGFVFRDSVPEWVIDETALEY